MCVMWPMGLINCILAIFIRFANQPNFFYIQKINEKVQIITEYENGKAIPNQQVLAKMERVLGK